MRTPFIAHPVIERPWELQILELSFWRSPRGTDYLDIHFSGNRGGWLRFTQPVDLSIESGFPSRTGGLYIADRSDDQLEGIGVQVLDLESNHGAVRFSARSVERVAHQCWVFHGEGAQFSSSVFRELSDARAWVAENRLTGVLTGYPFDESAYDWAVRTGKFVPQKPAHTSEGFIQRFTSGGQEHFHFVNGAG